MLGCALIAISAAVAWLSPAFAYGSSGPSRPILLILFLLAFGFIVCMCSIALALRCREDRLLGCAILIPALLCRVLLLFSEPIQEIDIYRYVWDGAVVSNGVSPYHYSPQNVLLADADNPTNGKLSSLTQIRDASPVLAEVLRRIHYSELPTVYPPVSQAVFASAYLVTPSKASISTRVAVTKAAILTFDIATIVLIAWLLVLTGRHIGWVIAYAWSPLVLKEFANSGHLDSIAVFLTICAVISAVRLLMRNAIALPAWSTILPGILLGLAVGAKLYPIILLPLLVIFLSVRLGWRHAACLGTTAVVAGCLSLSPMILASPAVSGPNIAAIRRPQPVEEPGNPQHLAIGLADSPATHPLDGLRTFLKRWEMNDFLFLLVIENLRPNNPSTLRPEPWFAIVPNEVRYGVANLLATHFAISPDDVALIGSRVICAGIFLAVAIGLIWRAVRQPDADSFLEAAFLTLAWLWLLSPTQNPWYWIWALPLVPFARGKAWFAISGLVLAYYLRFWFVYHWPTDAVLETIYNGSEFFDFVIVWIEYGPWFFWLGLAAAIRHQRQFEPRTSGRRSRDTIVVTTTC